MRDLMKSDRNRVEFDDTLSGTKLGLFYTTPTVNQIKAYRQASITRKGNKVVVNNFDPALKYGLEILTGIDEGCFGYDGKPISSDPDSMNFRDDWKKLLQETAADIITMLAHVVFDGVKSGKDTMEFEGEVEEAVPFEKS